MRKIEPEKKTTNIAIPIEINKEFRKICVNKDLKPHEVVRSLFTSFIEKEKKKAAPLVVNG